MREPGGGRREADGPDALFIAFQEAVAGRYSLQRELGRGGMGVVYLAREVRLDRPVAIKLLPPDLAAHHNLRERFMREARTAARLSHPYIVPIHAVDEVGGFVFYVMAYVDGETLAERVTSRGPMPPAEATRVLREVAWALAYAHAQGIVHRDVKPANILLERGTGRAMVTDFGIARLTHASGETAVGELLGTPEYMSPEQASGESVDGRSDIYSLGIVAYYAVSGTLPFTAPTSQAVLAKQVTQTPAPVASVARGIPRPLAQTIDACLEKDAARRMQNGEALADALAPALEQRAEIPVPIRAYLDRRRMGVALALPAMLVPSLAIAIEHIASFGVRSGWMLMLIAQVAAIVAIPTALIAGRLRPLLRLGYTTDDIAAALQVRYDRQREEFFYERGTHVSKAERLLGVLGIAGFGVSIVSAVALILGTANPAFLVGMTAGAYVGMIASVLSNRWMRLRRGVGSFWAKRWRGRMGRVLSGIASLKLGKRAIVADRPTEVAIALSADAVFNELPKDVRKSFGDVPGALRALELQARVIRARIAELDAIIVETQAKTSRADVSAKRDTLIADLRSARADADKRLADLVTALETVRLDLLRLRAGQGSADSITQNLEAARALGDDVDRLIAGDVEAEAVLRHEHADTPV